MKGVTKAAKQHNGWSRMCEHCTMKKLCQPYISRICHDAFVEGFKKGAKWANKQVGEINIRECLTVPKLDYDKMRDEILKGKEERNEIRIKKSR